MSKLSSRQRMLAALQCQEPDHVPLVFNVFGFRPPQHLAWSNPIEEARRWLSMGVDSSLRLALPPLIFHPEVETRDWEEALPGERWPLMIKEYDTPAGLLRQEVYRTEDWASPDWPSHHPDTGSAEAPQMPTAGQDGSTDLRLLDDHNVPRSRSFAIETEEDLRKLEYLFHPLTDEAVTQFKETCTAISHEANELGVLLEAYPGVGLADVATWLCGVEGMLFMALDTPDVFDALLDIVHEQNKRNVEILLDTPVDLIVQRGWYEGTAFWSPTLYRQFFVPRLRELTDMVHQGNRLMGYIMTTGFMPLLDIFTEVGYDAHYYIDPVPGGSAIDLQKVKQVFDTKVAIIGGLNSPVTLEQGSPDDIRQEVFRAVDILGPGGGLALSPVDCISASTPWESVEILIEAWTEVRDYPIM